MKSLIPWSLLGLALCFATPAIAGPRGGGMGPINPRIIERAADELGLKPDKREALRELYYTTQKKVIPLKSQVEVAKVELKHALDAPTPDRAQVMKRLEALSAAELGLKKAKLGLMLDVRALLTPEQVQQLRKLQRQHRKNRRQRREGKRKRRGDF